MTLNFTIHELEVLKKIIQHHNPDKEDEMIALMLYARITRKLEEKNDS